VNGDNMPSLHIPALYGIVSLAGVEPALCGATGGPRLGLQRRLGERLIRLARRSSLLAAFLEMAGSAGTSIGSGCAVSGGPAPRA
jgi:hypothetical protein